MAIWIEIPKSDEKRTALLTVKRINQALIMVPLKTMAHELLLKCRLI